MAYPEVAGPYGLKPVGLVGGRPYNNGFSQYPIASGYATAIFNGDIVTLTTGGVVERETADAAVVSIGVFMGCSYTDPDMGLVFRNSYPAGTVADDIMAFVVDDPEVLFKAAVLSSGTTIGDLAQTDVGANVALVDNAGIAINGISQVGVSDTSATTATLPFRIVKLVPETRNSLGGFTEAIVKWNAGHQLTNTTGV